MLTDWAASSGQIVAILYVNPDFPLKILSMGVTCSRFSPNQAISLEHSR